MGFEAAQQAMNTAQAAPVETARSAEPANAGEAASAASSTSNGSSAPDSASTAQAASSVLDLTKAEKFLWEGKEMTPAELKKSILRQQDYTKKTQSHAEERRRFEEERRAFVQQQEETEKYNSNLDADIQNVLRDPSLEAKFKEIYPEKYHRHLDQALTKSFGDRSSPDSEVKSLKQQLQAQDAERAKTAFETEVRQHAEILDSNIARLATKYPHADEDSVLARAEYMAASMKKDANFNDNFSKLIEKLYQENHQHHEKRYKEIYGKKVESQKQANAHGKDIGRGGGTPAQAPQKMKLKDVKNHILSTMGQS
jgi:hypothetical protein